MASSGVSEMLGTPLSFRAVSRLSAPLALNPAIFKNQDSRFVIQEEASSSSQAKNVSAANDELAKWYAYINSYDPFGLGKKPQNFAKYQAFELIHARFSMLGAAGFIIPDALNKYGANCGHETVLFKTGALLLDGNTLNYFGKNITINLVLAVVAEDFEDKFHPGGPFDPLGPSKDPKQGALLKIKEIKNGRLAMFAKLGFFIQAYVTGEGPVENLSKHLTDHFGNNLLTVIAGTAERAPTL
ncbi:hypothetical protein N665_0150s0008 [Sinapis alba]|nr:hypothetical protein N665_0150s0008 [Sinapis alba]